LQESQAPFPVKEFHYNYLLPAKECDLLYSVLPLCQNDNDITRTASFINTPNDTEICALPQGRCHESLFIKKLKIEDSENWMKIEEFLSSGFLKKLLKNRA